MSDDDREILEFLAHEIASELNGNILEAEAVNAATIPTPIVEIEFAEYVVEMALSIHWHAPEE